MAKEITFNPFTSKLDYVSVEDLSGYVPYVGATTNVDLGANEFSAWRITATGTSYFNDKSTFNLGAIFRGNSTLRVGASFELSGADNPSRVEFYDDTLCEGNYWAMMSGGTNIINIHNAADTSMASLSVGSLTTNRTFTFPDASGTFALLENTQTFIGDKAFTGDLILKPSADVTPLSGSSYWDDANARWYIYSTGSIAWKYVVLGGHELVNTLGDINNVTLTSPQNGQVLAYNSTSQEWENQAGGAGVAKESHIQFVALATAVTF